MERIEIGCLMKKRVMKSMNGEIGFDPESCILETVDGVGSSVVVSLSAVGDSLISITMNGKKMLADVVLFSLEGDESSDVAVI